MKMNQTICLALAASSLTGCMIGMVADAYTAETPESEGVAPANYRGKSCLQLAVERESAKVLLNHTGDHQDYVRKQGQWTTASVEQVEGETGCLPGTTAQQAGFIDYVLKHPESLKELEPQLPPGGLEYIKAGGRLAANTSSALTNTPVPSPASAPQTIGSRWGATTPEGLPKTSLDQWIAKETPEIYQGRSCEYLQRSLAESESMEASAEVEVRTLGASKKRVISEVLAGRECPASKPPVGGRLGAGIDSVDPIKAARLGMPLAGSSIEQVVPGGPAEHAGIKFADVVVAVGATPISDHIDLLIALSKISPGSTALLRVWRKGTYINVPVILGAPVISQAEKAMVSASTSSLQGMNLGTVTPSYAKAVGLSSAQGAWVIDTVKGSAADKAGIKALDVIIEVGGQVIASAQDVADITSRMRAGYKASVIVWRNQTKRDVQMVLKNE